MKTTYRLAWLTTTLTSLAASLSTSTIAAQSVDVYGLSVETRTKDVSMTTATGCSTPSPMCSTGLKIMNAYEGGISYSARRDAWWISDGVLLQERGARCTLTCNTRASLALGTSSRVGGLSSSARLLHLYHVESIAGSGAIVTYSLTTTCPTPLQTCTFSLPSRSHRTSALAYDDRRRSFYVASTDGVSTTIQHFQASTCNLLCSWQVPATCGSFTIRGIRAMEYDECRDTLVMSDGAIVLESRLTHTPSGCPQVSSRVCCQIASSTLAYHGLDIQDGKATAVGTSCTSRPCATCPTMALQARGRPVVGNADFALALENAPAQSIAVMILSAGACNRVAFGCGGLFPQLANPTLTIPVLTNGRSGCEGSARVPLPVPAAYSWCGQKLCTQFAIFCPSVGIALTNGLLLEIE
ncbi:MAG: hypothetical protein KDC95_14015 [Planctomycetes bacterium]|nr:hypothetical protein [Planctomycetota bacterium]